MSNEVINHKLCKVELLTSGGSVSITLEFENPGSFNYGGIPDKYRKAKDRGVWRDLEVAVSEEQIPFSASFEANDNILMGSLLSHLQQGGGHINFTEEYTGGDQVHYLNCVLGTARYTEGEDANTIEISGNAHGYAQGSFTYGLQRA